jgi:hypothetical protein
MDQTSQFIASLFTSILVAAITAYITVFLSQRQYYSQKWWDRKADTYSKIMESLYSIQHRLQMLLEEDAGERHISAETMNELRKKSNEGFEDIDRISKMGVFLLSKEVEEIVSRLNVEINKVENGDFYTDAYEIIDITNKYLRLIRDAAMKDLHVEK